MRRLRILDYFVFLLFALVLTGSVLWSSSGREGALRAEIEASGVLHVMPLEQNGTLLLEGPVGDTLVEVSDGEVFIVHSDCRDELCVAMGGVSKPSGWIACLPNRVFVRVVAVQGTGAKVPEGDVDATAF